MQNSSIPNCSKFSATFFIGLFLVLVMGWLSLVGLGDVMIGDPFHQGEYFAAFASMFVNQGSHESYLTIHGALDYIPAWLSSAIYGQSNYFFGTIFFYSFAYVLAAVLLYLLVSIIIGKGASHYKNVALILAAILPQMMVGYKDVLLLISLLLYFLCQQGLGRVPRGIAEGALGITVALNVFWSFDRGIAGVVSIGLACLILLYRKRLYWIALLSFLSTISMLHFRTANFNLQRYAENIQFLMNTSSQWSFGWKLMPVMLSVTLFLLCVSALVILVKFTSKNRPLSDEEIANSVLLGLLTILFFKIGTNRADLGHIYEGMWPAALAFLYGQSAKERSRVRVQVPFAIDKAFLALVWRAGYVNVSFLVVFFALIAASVPRNGRHLVERLVHPPTNSALVGEGVKWVVAEIKNTKSNCVFDLANHGVINGLTGLPSCTRFTYPVYADRRYESEMIESIKNRKPPVIVYSSTNRSFSIDNQSMHERLPGLRSYLDNAYPYEMCKFEYCLRYLSERSRDQAKDR